MSQWRDIRHEAQIDSPLWQFAVVALVPTHFVGVSWRGAMLMLGDAPGAEHWLALHKAGVRATRPVVLAMSHFILADVAPGINLNTQ